MIKYICKKCNINTATSICPVCGERAEVENSIIYWCDDCNIPLYDSICPICGRRANRIGSDLRPVFPEERLLLEVMLGEPFKYKNAAVWNASGNFYYADGKKIPFSVKQTKLLDVKKIREQLEALSSQNSYKFFNENIRKFLIANRQRYDYISNEAMEYIRTMAEGVSLTEMFVSFSGGKDSTVVSDLVLRALGTQQEDTGNVGRQIDGVTAKIRRELYMTAQRFTAEEDLRERQEIKSLFNDGLLQVVTAIKCLDEGVNIPSIRTAFIMASTRNPREFIQRRGRLLRRSPNKDYAEIYDMITLPKELSSVSHLDYEKDRNIIIGEMARINEFGKLSDNPAQAEGMMNQIMQAYDVYLDIEEEMQKMEDEYDE